MSNTSVTIDRQSGQEISHRWQSHARKLARWTNRHLVNRSDVWGGYLPEKFRKSVDRPDGTKYVQKSVTKPAKAKRGEVFLSEEIIYRHYAAQDIGDIIGLHSTSSDNTSLWIGIDVDKHEGDTADPAANLNAAIHWYQKLVALGFSPLLTDSNGRGGFHLLAIFARPIMTAQALAFARYLVSDHVAAGLEKAPETFPKQAEIQPDKFGNWLRLPGRHHTLEHFSRVWNGKQWLEGEAAAEFILSIVPSKPSLVPPLPEPEPAPVKQPIRMPQSNGVGRMTETEIALKCLDHLQCFDDHTQWVQIGMALHAVDPSSAMLEAWDAWSRRSNKWTEGECARRWQSFSPRGGVTIATLIEMARREGFEVFPQPRAAQPPASSRPAKTEEATPATQTQVGDELQAEATSSGKVEDQDADQGCSSVTMDQDGLIPLGERDPESGRLVLSPERTLPTAAAFIRSFYGHKDGRTLHSYAGMFWEWKGNRYCEAEEGSMRQILQPWLHDATRYICDKRSGEMKLVDFESNPGTVSAAVDSIRDFTHLPAESTPPRWLSSDSSLPDPRDLLPCRSHNLHVPTGKLYAPSPKLFNINALEFDYDPNPEPPERWIRFLEQLWGDDLESVQLLQEWMGYCLVADTSQQKMLMMVGPKRSGKGTIGRIISQLVGAGNVVGPTTSSIAGDFGLQALIGKSVAIISDARFTGEKVGTLIERLLCISGEDPLSIDRKFKGSITMTLPTRFIFLTNELPRINDASGALAGRFVFLRLTQSFYGKEDVTLTDQLRAELPGILLWAINGLKHMRQRGRFLMPASVADAIQELEDLASPVLAFARDRLNIGPNERSWVDDTYEQWKSWCREDGRVGVTTKQIFGRDLSAAIPSVVCRRNQLNGRFYSGIGIKAGFLSVAEGPG